MPDPREQLRRKFESNRFANFGNVITKFIVKNVRCHTNTIINVESPITAFSGFNGTGKSTLLHLAAAAYKHEDGHYQSSRLDNVFTSFFNTLLQLYFLWHKINIDMLIRQKTRCNI